MSYIDKDYYDNDYKGKDMDDVTFERLVKRASDVIDIITSHKLISYGFDKYPDLVKSQIKKATASQIDYLYTNGESNSMGAGGFGQVSAGNFSYGDKAGADELSRAEQMTSESVMGHLRPTGLLYQGVDIYG